MNDQFDRNFNKAFDTVDESFKGVTTGMKWIGAASVVFSLGAIGLGAFGIYCAASYFGVF